MYLQILLTRPQNQSRLFCSAYSQMVLSLKGVIGNAFPKAPPR